jgi:hypothetical protein
MRAMTGEAAGACCCWGGGRWAGGVAGTGTAGGVVCGCWGWPQIGAGGLPCGGCAEARRLAAMRAARAAGIEAISARRHRAREEDSRMDGTFGWGLTGTAGHLPARAGRLACAIPGPQAGERGNAGEP